LVTCKNCCFCRPHDVRGHWTIYCIEREFACPSSPANFCPEFIPRAEVWDLKADLPGVEP
jgi:hypothetical protein